MAQFRTTADLIDSILTRAGETTSGTSSYDSNGDVLNYLNRVHFSLLAGGTVSLGKDSTVEIDETWDWARSKRPIIIELQPKYDSASVTLTLSSEAGTLSTAPSYSMAGWYLEVDGNEGLYRIASHTASSTSFELDGAWPNDSVSSGSCRIFQLDYDIIPSYMIVDTANNKVQFQETSGTTITGTLTSGSYTPSDLATHVGSVMTSAGSSTYTVTYSSVTKYFTIASDRSGGGGVFIFVGTGDQSNFSIHKDLGFDDVNSSDAASVTSTYILGGIARLIEPMKRLRGIDQEIFGTDSESFSRDYSRRKPR